jgi:PEP-CTERM motif
MPLLTRLLLTLAVAAAAVPPLAHGAAPRAPRNDTLASCSWDRPGRDPFMGDVVAAVDRYRDIPTAVRDKLKQRMRARQYDDLVDIRRDEIKGQFQYAAAIRDMHFGSGRVCREVTRARWTARMHERGLVYCEAEHCILVPTICRNVSRIDRQPGLVAGDALEAPPPTVPEPGLASAARATPAGDAVPPANAAATPPVEPITSSFSEAVAGATIPLFTPPGDAADPGAGGGFGNGGSAPVGDVDNGAGPAFPPLLFAPGGPGAVPTVVRLSGSDTPGGGDGGGGGGGGGGGPIDPGSPPPVAPIPEPSTWASLLAGLALLAWVVARQRRAATGTPKCATQKRS